MLEEDELIQRQEKQRMEFMKRQTEKNYYLGEYKERVIAALNKDQIIEDEVYPEIITAMKDSRAYIVKMTREIKISYLKPYIKKAEEIGIKYELIDGISYVGNVGLVVVSKQALNDQNEEVLIRDMDQDFIDAGLGEVYSKNRGKKICSECYKKVEKLLPKYIDDFEKLGFFDKLIGIKCPICEKEYKKQELGVRRMKR